MKGDFSRGYRPDAKRGQRYRRVLLQQGRVLLDSDHAAMVDAGDRALRELSEDLFGSGSSSQGFRITPGTLYATFERPSSVIASEPGFTMFDYGRQFFGAPSLRLLGHDGNTVTVEVELEVGYAQGDTLRIWYLADKATTLDCNGVTLPVAPTNDQFVAGDIVMGPASERLRLLLAPGDRIWIGMIEGRLPAPDASSQFCVAGGRYTVGGVVADNPAPATWPEQAFPAALGFDPTLVNPLPSLPADTSFLVYLETWERLLTHLHDPGIRERGLGAGVDTTVRTKIVGQVKVVDQIGSLTAADLTTDSLTHALAAPKYGDGTIEIRPPDVTDIGDVDAGLFTGRENRLYHFEVHDGGALGTARLKWSNRGGAEVFEIVAATSDLVTLARDCPLRDGDLVEVLSEVIELGDDGVASFDVDGTFCPPTRTVGLLALLQSQGQDGVGNRLFRLREPVSPHALLTLDAPRYATPQHATMLRRWNGLFTTSANPASIEDGIQVDCSGTFEVGSWWQWEVRVSGFNDNGPWQPTAHGPERRFVPLATLKTPANVNKPLELERWHDNRFAPLGEQPELIESQIRSIHDLDLLLSYRGFGRRYDDLGGGGSASEVLQQLVNEIPEGDEIVLPPGVYLFDSIVTISKDLVIRGRPGTILVQTVTYYPLFRISGNVRFVELEMRTDPSLFVNGVLSMIQVLSASTTLELERCVMLAKQSEVAAVYYQNHWIPTIIGTSVYAPLDPGSRPLNIVPHVVMRECMIMAGRALALGTGGFELHDCHFLTWDTTVSGKVITQFECTNCVLSDQLDSFDLEYVFGQDWTQADDPIDYFKLHFKTRNTYLSPSGGWSAGLALQQVYEGRISGSTVFGRLAAFSLESALRIHVSDTTFWSPTLAVHAYNLGNCTFRDSRLIGSLYCLRTTTAFTFENCEVKSLRVATSNIGQANVDAIEGHGINIIDNRIDPVGTIVVGNTSMPTGSRIHAVQVRGNLIPAKDDGQGVVGWVIYVASPSSAERLAAIVVCDNQIERKLGGGGIMVNGCRNARVEGNSIVIRDVAARAIYIYNSLDIGVHRNSVAYEHTDSANRIIEFDNGNGLNITGNSVTGDQAELYIESLANGHVLLHDNMMASIDVRMNGGNVSIADNLFGTLESINAGGGEVRGNTTHESYASKPNSLKVEGLVIADFAEDSEWVVSNNAVHSAALRVIPKSNNDYPNFDAGLEVKFGAIVEGNRAQSIQVGYVGGNSLIDTDDFVNSKYGREGDPTNASWVMVTGNHVENIYVNNYATGRRVFANNIFSGGKA